MDPSGGLRITAIIIGTLTSQPMFTLPSITVFFGAIWDGSLREPTFQQS